MLCSKQKHGGFTFVEMIVALAVGTLFLVVAYQFLLASQQFYSIREDKVEYAQNGRVVMDKMVRELRQAEAVVTILPSQEIEFKDGHTPATERYIRYFLQNRNIMREEIMYYFPSAPDIAVLHSDRDASNNPPLKRVLGDAEKVAEFGSNLNFEQNGVLIRISYTIGEGSQEIPFVSEVAKRN